MQAADGSIHETSNDYIALLTGHISKENIVLFSMGDRGAPTTHLPVMESLRIIELFCRKNAGAKRGN